MSGYVFHCTPCGKPHAGECPPKKLPDRTWGEVLDEFVEDIDKPFKQALVSAVQAGLPNFPGVGDFYTYEVWNSKLGGWQHSQAVYEITGWHQHVSVSGQTTNTVNYKVPGGKLMFDMDLQAFDPKGLMLSTGDLTRFVGPIPASPPPSPGITYPAPSALPVLGSFWSVQLFIGGAWLPPDHRRYQVTSVDPNKTTVAQHPGNTSARWKYPNAAWTTAGWTPPLGNPIRFIP